MQNKYSWNDKELQGYIDRYANSLDFDMEVKLLTGRTHQIRASCAAIGNPLVGDVKYGAKKNGKNDFQMLCAYKLEFNFTTPAGELEYLGGKKVQIDCEF